jgi:hypothetical protein
MGAAYSTPSDSILFLNLKRKMPFESSDVDGITTLNWILKENKCMGWINLIRESIVAVSCEDFHEPSDFLKGGELF